MTSTDQRQAYALGEAEDERATKHQRLAAEAVQDDPQGPLVAVVHALLALEARVEELTAYVTQLG